MGLFRAGAASPKPLEVAAALRLTVYEGAGTPVAHLGRRRRRNIVKKKAARKAKRAKARTPRTTNEPQIDVDFTPNTLLGSASDRPRKVRGG